MAIEEHISILKQGVDVWNSWRSKNPSIKPDLTGADLRNGVFTEANTGYPTYDFDGYVPSGSDLTSADLTGANLTGASLAYVKLTGAKLTKADLTGADLTGANLT